MMTKEEIRQRLIQLHTELSCFFPTVQKKMEAVSLNEQRLPEISPLREIQIDSSGNRVYKSDLSYIDYLRSIRELGFLASDIYRYMQQLTEVINAISSLILRTERFFPNSDTLALIREEFVKSALECEDIRSELGNVIGALDEAMLIMSRSYVTKPEYKKAMNAQFVAIGPSIGVPLWNWFKPWVEMHCNVLPSNVRPLDLALDTLRPLSQERLAHSLQQLRI